MYNDSVFEEYVKIAKEKGLISIAEEHSDKRKDFYDLKIGDSNDELIDKAHPKSVVILPAYNDVNGLIENIKQRHSIMEDIVNRKPAGNFKEYFYEKSAKANVDLLNETIKIGYQLDLSGEDDLAIFADQCSNNLVKKAWVGVAALIVGAVSALGYLAYLSNNPSSQGIRSDIQRALSEIEKIREDDSKIASNLTSLKSNLEILLKKAQSFFSYNDELMNSLLTISGSSKEQKRQAVVENAKKFIGQRESEIVKNFQDFQEYCETVLNTIPLAISYLNKANEESADSSNAAWYQIKKYFRTYVWNSNYEDLIKVLVNLKESLSKVPSSIQEQILKMKEIQNLSNQLNNISLQPTEKHDS